MPDLAELAAVLIGCRVVTRDRWDRAARARGATGASSEIDELLAILTDLSAEPPHWWDGKAPAPPGLTDYQLGMIRSRFADDEVAFLRRDLALNQFLLLAKLGQGGQGEVYRARQLNPPRFAAVKTLIRDTEVRRRRFEQEARSMMKVQHPAIARFYLYERVRDPMGEPTDEYLIAMEFVNGAVLHRLVQRSGPVPWPFAVHWAIELLEGLAAIHKNGFVHGDVKPENVMVLGPPMGTNAKPEATAAKLLDFGAAKRLDGTSDEDVEPRKTFVGTPEYAPPEQWTGSVSAASDVYALGGTMLFVLTGQFPYQMDRRDPQAYRRSHTHDEVPDVRALNASVPAELAELLQRMMAKDPEDRGSAEELNAALREMLPRSAEPPSGPRPRRTPTPLESKAVAKATPAAEPRDAEVVHPLYRLVDGLLALCERTFVPGYHRPPPGEEAAIQERLAGLLRRPLVLAILGVVLFFLFYGCYLAF